MIGIDSKTPRLFQLLKDKKLRYYKHDLTDNLYK